MLSALQSAVSNRFDLTTPRGIFLSCFDADGSLLQSHGVLTTDKPLQTVINMLYQGIVEPYSKQVKHIICDVVIETQLLNTMEEISAVDILTHGLCITTIDYAKSGIILPGTQGVNNVSHMIQLVKEKNQIEGNVMIFSFQSNRIQVSI